MSTTPRRTALLSAVLVALGASWLIGFGGCGEPESTVDPAPFEAAIATYRSSGMREDGYEVHSFAPYQRREQLLRLVATQYP